MFDRETGFLFSHPHKGRESLIVDFLWRFGRNLVWVFLYSFPYFNFCFCITLLLFWMKLTLQYLLQKINHAGPICPSMTQRSLTEEHRGGKLTHGLATKQFSLSLLFLFPSIFREGENVVAYPRLFSSFQCHPSSFITYLINEWIPFY